MLDFIVYIIYIVFEVNKMNKQSRAGQGGDYALVVKTYPDSLCMFVRPPLIRA